MLLQKYAQILPVCHEMQEILQENKNKNAGIYKLNIKLMDEKEKMPYNTPCTMWIGILQILR